MAVIYDIYMYVAAVISVCVALCTPQSVGVEGFSIQSVRVVTAAQATSILHTFASSTGCMGLAWWPPPTRRQVLRADACRPRYLRMFG